MSEQHTDPSGQTPALDHSGPQEGDNADSGHATQRPEDGGATDRDRHSAGDDGQQQTEERRFTQADLDRIAAQRAREAERRAERRVMRMLGTNRNQSPPAASPPPPTDERELTRKDFASDDDYVDYRVERKLKAERAARESTERDAAQRRARETVDSAYRDAESIEGFDREAYDELELTGPITHAVLEADRKVRGRLMHAMARDPARVERISRLSPVQQAKAMGAWESSLEGSGGRGAESGASADPDSADRRQPSRAPRPGTAVGGGNQGQRTGDLSRSPMDQYVAQRKRQGAKWAAG